ncbi:hypothetical protein AB0N65_18920 [Paenarthrobacter sp. NPDC089322]|uniref:hypothetical protein n=1 Tax=Paenarthrobacter sp. NPDC089322 TaxID=3155065 RepID=UPI003431C9A6
MTESSPRMTPRTFTGRVCVYLAFTSGLWSVQWLLRWATSGLVPQPTLLGLFMLAGIFLFWFFLPPVPWFPAKRRRDRKD